jgi:hypothetical protein
MRLQYTIWLDEKYIKKNINEMDFSVFQFANWTSSLAGKILLQNGLSVNRNNLFRESSIKKTIL